MDRPKVIFICVHNSCRSQMAEALGTLLAGDICTSYSGRTELVPKINGDAVEVIKELYEVDMNETQTSKLLSTLPPADIVITMGCNVECPYLPCKYREDWGIDDPTGKPQEEFVKTAKTIEEKVLVLKERIVTGNLNSYS